MRDEGGMKETEVTVNKGQNDVAARAVCCWRLITQWTAPVHHGRGGGRLRRRVPVDPSLPMEGGGGGGAEL